MAADMPRLLRPPIAGDIAVAAASTAITFAASMAEAASGKAPVIAMAAAHCNPPVARGGDTLY